MTQYICDRCKKATTVEPSKVSLKEASGVERIFDVCGSCLIFFRKEFEKEKKS